MTDVVVVGAGVAGLCVAEGLARAGAEVVCAEAAAIGAGASGQGSGQLLLGVVEAPHRVLASIGETRTRELFALTEHSIGWLADRGLLDRRGQVSVALDERESVELETTAAVLDALGFEASLHGPSQIAERFGLDGTMMLAVGQGGRVRPDVALTGLAEGARAAGVRLFEEASVTHIDERTEGFVVDAGEHRIRAEMVVWAAGVATRDLEPALRESMTPVREQAIEIRGLPATENDGARAGFGWTWFERTGDVGVVGGCRWATPHFEVGETEAVIEPRVQSKIEGFATRLGWLGTSGVARRWAWIDAHTRDHLPLVGPVPGSTRLLACTGFCGNDWGLGPGAAALVVEGMVGARAETVGQFAPSRFL